MDKEIIVKSPKRIYTDEQKKRNAIRDKLYRLRNLEKIKERQRQYYLKNKDAILKKFKEYHIKNRDKIIQRKREYYKKDPERQKAINKKYVSSHREKVNASKLRYHHNKEKNNLNYRLCNRLRTRTREAIKIGSKSGSAVQDLGCSIDELKIYLQGKFVGGMSWDNYGEWHIDHIIPISSFNLEDREQFLKACHFTNLQPLWKIDNLKKGNIH